jgi:very-short-patch-repair endonuclease
MSIYEDQLADQMLGWLAPEREHVFHPTRKWRFDFAWPSLMVAVEVEGATWHAGRHTRGSGFEKDAEKYAEAAILGWRVIRVTADMVVDGRAVAFTRRLLDSAERHAG